MKYTQPQTLEKLHRMVERDMPMLEHISIIKEDNRYLVFGIYQVTHDPGTGRVAVSKNDIFRHEFTGLRTALSWCIADKYQQFPLTQNIERLDADKSSLEADLAVRQPLAHRIKDAFLRESVMLKIDTRKRRLIAVTDQLDKCVNLAKYWQIRGFNNETARTGRTSTTRTNI